MNGGGGRLENHVVHHQQMNDEEEDGIEKRRRRSKVAVEEEEKAQIKCPGSTRKFGFKKSLLTGTAPHGSPTTITSTTSANVVRTGFALNFVLAVRQLKSFSKPSLSVLSMSLMMML